MPTITGNTGTPGVSGSDGADSTSGTVAGGNATSGTSGGNGQVVSVTITAANFDSYSLTGGTGGVAGNGGNGGDGGRTTTDTYSGDFLVRRSTTSSSGGTGGAGGKAGDGGSASIAISNVTTVGIYSLAAQGGIAASSGGTGGQGGNGAYGDSISDPYHSGYFDSYNNFHYVGYAEVQQGRAGRSGQNGGTGGNGGDATILASNLNITGEGAVWIEFRAMAGYASGGGAGGYGGDGSAGGNAGAAGNGGNGGDATLSFTNATSQFGANIYLLASAGTGGIGRDGGRGGFGYTHSATYTAPNQASESTTHNNGLGGAGGNGGNGGDSRLTATGNSFTGTAADEQLNISLFLKAGGAGAAGSGGVNGINPDTQVFAANGTGGTAGTTGLAFSGNTLNGGAGNDTLFLTLYNESASSAGYAALGGVTINLQSGTFKIGAEANTITGVENVYLDINDFYYEVSTASDHTAAASLSGTAGNNKLYSSRGNDTLAGLGGDDTLDGGQGADLMKGGLGDDTFYVDNAGDRVLELNDQGNDIVYASASFNTGGQYIETVVLTGSDNANLNGNGLANVLTGNAGNNVLNGAVGNDTMTGGTGDDTYYIDSAGDVIVELAGEGKDVVYASFSYTLLDNFESLVLTGFQALDGTGNALDNAITGNDAVNRLSGGDGKDILIGKGGNDILSGGAAADQFRFAQAGTANGLDHITDFESGIDKLIFLAADYGFAKGHKLTAAELHGGGAVGAGPQFLYNAVNHTLYWDGDGAGGNAPVAVIVFDNNAMPVAGDFTFL